MISPSVLAKNYVWNSIWMNEETLYVTMFINKEELRCLTSE